MGTYYIRSDLGNTIETGSQTQPFKTINSLMTAVNGGTTFHFLSSHIIRIWADEVMDISPNAAMRIWVGSNWTIERWFDNTNFSKKPILTRAKRDFIWTHDTVNDVWVSDALADIKYGCFMTEDGAPLILVLWNTNRATTIASMVAGTFMFDQLTLQYIIKPRTGTPSDHQYVGVAGTTNFTTQGNNGGWTIREMDFRYSAEGLGVNGNNLGGWVLEDLDVSFIGGAVRTVNQYPAGNGIGITLCTGVNGPSYIRRCVISDIFDSGISPQMYDQNTLCRDITIDDVDMIRCGLHGYELSLTSSNPATVNNSVIDNVNIKNSRAIDSGKGWSGNRYGSTANGFAMVVGNTASGVRIINSTITKCQAIGCLGVGVAMYQTNGKNSAVDNQISGCGTGMTLTAKSGYNGPLTHQFLSNDITSCGTGLLFGRDSSGSNTATLRGAFNTIRRCNVGILNFTKVGDTAMADDNTITECATAIQNNGTGTFTKARNILFGNTANYSGTTQGTDVHLSSADVSYFKPRVAKKISITQ